MGLIKKLPDEGCNTLANQGRGHFCCEAIPDNVLVMKGHKSSDSGNSHTRGNENAITSGAVIMVTEGQCVMIVDQGKILEFAAEPGEYTYDASTVPACFCGDLGERIRQSFEQLSRHLAAGCEPTRDRRIYYFNIKTLAGNKYVTQSPVSFHAVDKHIGLDAEISIRCVGSFTYRICDPMLFYKNVCGNVNKDFYRDSLDGQLKNELLSALESAFTRISSKGIGYSELPDNAMELTDVLNEILDSKWRKIRGLELNSFAVSNIRVSEKDETMIRKLQEAAAIRNMDRPWINVTETPYPKDNPMRVMDMSRRELREQSAPGKSWKCGCGNKATGRFCSECGGRPAEQGWKCTCGTFAHSKFCPECGSPRPSEDRRWRCFCGYRNSGNFCPNCGRRKPASNQNHQGAAVLPGMRRSSR